jgi:hypothetical protein
MAYHISKFWILLYILSSYLSDTTSKIQINALLQTSGSGPMSQSSIYPKLYTNYIYRTKTQLINNKQQEEEQQPEQNNKGRTLLQSYSYHIYKLSSIF